MFGKGDKYVFFYVGNYIGKKFDCYDSYVIYRKNIK